MKRKFVFEIIVTSIMLAFSISALYLAGHSMLSSTSFSALIVIGVSFIIFAFMWELGVFDNTYKLFSMVFKGTKPVGTKAKIIIALVSVFYGILALYILHGPYAYLPFFIGPYGLVDFFLALIVLVIVYFALVYILKRIIR